ncbi:tdpoz5 [Trichonephila clavata]|uniref:Tdpoz5 n=1 Tax=Trichonephila clavata TaxID=2740835 RepID=A0A8X6LNE2_TRICU|nr:tdpoz5 [Trichonephila clavata]
MKKTGDNEVYIPHIDASVLRAFMTYMYTGHIENLPDVQPGNLLHTADKYELEGLKIVDKDLLKSNTTAENVLQFLVLADLFACFRFERFCNGHYPRKMLRGFGFRKDEKMAYSGKIK